MPGRKHGKSHMMDALRYGSSVTHVNFLDGKIIQERINALKFHRPQEGNTMKDSKNDSAPKSKKPKQTMTQLRQEISILQENLKAAIERGKHLERIADDRLKAGQALSEKNVTAISNLNTIDTIAKSFMNTVYPTGMQRLRDADHSSRHIFDYRHENNSQQRQHPNNTFTRFINEILMITSDPKPLSDDIEA